MAEITKTWEDYETIDRPDLPPLGPWFYNSRYDPDGPYWDREGQHLVDMDALVEAGYLRKVRITETREYI